MKHIHITDYKQLGELRARFYDEIKGKPLTTSIKTWYQTPGTHNKAFEDFEWYYDNKYDMIIRKNKVGF